MIKRERIYHKLKSPIIFCTRTLPCDAEKLNTLLSKLSVTESKPFYSVDNSDGFLGIVPTIEGCSATFEYNPNKGIND